MSYRIPMSNSCGGTRFAASPRRAFVSRQDDECALLLAKRILDKRVVAGALGR
jgi:hypothetical protein